MDIASLLSGQTDGLVKNLVDSLGFGEGEASGLVGGVVDQLGERVSDGGFNLSAFFEGGDGAQQLLGSLDVGELAATAGLSVNRTGEGLGALLPGLVDTIKGLAGDGLLDQIGGLLGGGDAASEGKGGGIAGALGGIAGGFLGKG